MSGLVFLDLETTGLDPQRHDIWEIGVIVRDPAIDSVDTEWLFRVPPDLRTAEPGALRVSRYYERTAQMDRFDPAEDAGRAYDLSVLPDGDDIRWSDPNTVAHTLAHILDGQHLVGAVPSFDAGFLNRWLPAHGQTATFHHHLIDVETLAVGYLHGTVAEHNMAIDAGAHTGKPISVPAEAAALPWRSDDLARACGVTSPDKAARHTALGDARWVRDWYDAITTTTGTGL